MNTSDHLAFGQEMEVYSCNFPISNSTNMESIIVFFFFLSYLLNIGSPHSRLHQTEFSLVCSTLEQLVFLLLADKIIQSMTVKHS